MASPAFFLRCLILFEKEREKAREIYRERERNRDGESEKRVTTMNQSKQGNKRVLLLCVNFPPMLKYTKTMKIKYSSDTVGFNKLFL